MSKTKGNVIDPLDVVYGATITTARARDVEKRRAFSERSKNFSRASRRWAPTLRFSLAALNTSGRYIRLSIDRAEGYRLINKL
jgi:valyl-tRNA synthetase